MGSVDLQELERRLKRKYEWTRLRRALLGLLPLMLVVLLTMQISKRPASALIFGSVAVTWGTLLLWYGRDVRRAVLPGVAAGLVPLTFALCANAMGHVCTGERCVSVCVPACVVGGLIAGLLVAAVGHRRNHGAAFWVSAASLSVLTGAMGCACVGYSGVLGLALGFGAGFLPSLLRASFGKPE
ncbi:MAG: hypothetical protein ACOY0T_06750 [Myxococcota bacterium]